MELLSAENIVFMTAGGRRATVSLVLHSGMRVALTGPHGSGKFRLLSILRRETEPLSGVVRTAPDAAPFPQPATAVLLQAETVLAAAARALAPLNRLEARIRELEHHLTDPAVLDEYAVLTEQFEKSGGYTAEAELRSLLAAFGFPASRLDSPPATLSAGELERVRLAGILAAGSPVLLLDQPGRELDSSMRQAVAERLRKWRGAVLFSSHDREFISACATHVADLTPGRLERRRGTFRPRRRLKAPAAGGGASRVLFSTDGVQLAPADSGPVATGPLTVHGGERILVAGENGRGGSGLLRFLAADVHHGAGISQFRWGERVRVLHFDPETAGLDPELSAAANVGRHVGAERTRQLLTLTGLGPEDRQKPAGELDPRGRARAGLAVLLAAQADLFLIDSLDTELDLPGIILLEETLATKEGTVIFTTRDMFLARNVALRVWSLAEGHLSDWRGGVSGWEQGRLRLEPGLARPEKPEAETAPAAREQPGSGREALEDRLLALEDLLAEAPLKNNPELTRRLERRRHQLTVQLMDAYAQGLPEPAPRFRVRENGVPFEADFDDGGRNLRFSALDGARPWLRIHGGTAHLGIREPADRCLLPAWRAALLNAAVRLAFQALPVSAVQYFDRAAPPGLRLQPAGGGWHVLSVRDFELLEGWEPREDRAA